MEFVGAGHKKRTSDCQHVSRNIAMFPACQVPERPLESAKADQRKCAISKEVPELAEDVMRKTPVAVDGRAEKCMQKIVQRLRSMVGAKSGRGF